MKWQWSFSLIEKVEPPLAARVIVQQSDLQAGAIAWPLVNLNTEALMWLAANYVALNPDEGMMQLSKDLAVHKLKDMPKQSVTNQDLANAMQFQLIFAIDNKINKLMLYIVV